MTTTTRAAKLAAAVLVLVAVPLAACGADKGSDDAVASLDSAAASSDSSTSTTDDDSAGGGRGAIGDDPAFQDAMLEYAQCMRDHGIDMPDPTFDDDGHVTLNGGGPKDRGSASDDAFEAADEACRSILEDAAPDISLSPEEQAEMQDQMLAMAQCMRAKGHDMPDPQVNDKGQVQVHVGEGDGGGPDRDDPDFQHDMEECSQEAGLRPPSSSGHAGNGSGGATTGGST
jgi:hypothetical protein